MNEVADEFLLTTASIAATLIGLLLLGGFFYVETGLRRAESIAPQGTPFLRATTQLTLVLYILVLAISLGLVVLDQPGLTIVYGIVAVALLVSMLRWTTQYRALSRVLPIPKSSPWLVWPAIVAMLVVPFVLDGWEPGREAMTWTVLAAGALALMSTTDLLLTSFDLAAWERAARDRSRAATDEDPGPSELDG